MAGVLNRLGKRSLRQNSWRNIPISRFDLKKGEQMAQAYENACVC